MALKVPGGGHEHAGDLILILRLEHEESAGLVMHEMGQSCSSSKHGRPVQSTGDAAERHDGNTGGLFSSARLQL